MQQRRSILEKLLVAAKDVPETHQTIVDAFKTGKREVIEYISRSKELSGIVLLRLFREEDFEHVKTILSTSVFNVRLLIELLEEVSDPTLIQAIHNSIGMNLAKNITDNNIDEIRDVLSIQLNCQDDIIKEVMFAVGATTSNVLFKEMLDSELVKEHEDSLHYAFISAIQNDRISIVGKLVDQKNIKNNLSILEHALIEAIRCNNYSSINRILNSTKISKKTSLLRKVYLKAAEIGSTYGLHAIAKTLNLNADDRIFKEAFTLAIKNSNFKVVPSLLTLENIKEDTDTLKEGLDEAIEKGELDVVMEISSISTISSNTDILLHAFKVAISKGQSTPHYFIAEKLLENSSIQENPEILQELLLHAKQHGADWIFNLLIAKEGASSNISVLIEILKISINKGESNIEQIISKIEEIHISSPEIAENKRNIYGLLSLSANQNQKDNFIAIMNFCEKSDRDGLFEFMYQAIITGKDKKLIKYIFIFFKMNNMLDLEDWGANLIIAMLPDHLLAPARGNFDILSEVISLTPSAYQILEQELYQNESASDDLIKRSSSDKIKALTSPSRLARILKPIIERSDDALLESLLRRRAKYHKRSVSTTEIKFQCSFDTNNLMQAYALEEGPEKEKIIDLLLNEYAPEKRSYSENRLCCIIPTIKKQLSCHGCF